MTNKTNTAAALLRATTTVAAGEMERDPVPAAIAELCAKRAGKPVTKRDAATIEERFPGLTCRISRRLGWTEIAWHAPGRTWNRETEQYDANPAGLALQKMGVPDSYNNERNIIIARRETGATWPTVDAFKAEHTHYFAARDERNAERAATLAAVEVDPTKGNITKAAALVDAIRENIAALDKLAAALPEETRRAIVDMIAAPIKEARTESILWSVRYSMR